MRERLSFEFASRGDRVSGRLWSDASAGARALVLVAPALGSSQRAPEVEALCRALTREGLAAATLDLPLQGERAGRKLSARLLDCAGRTERSAADTRLWAEFLRQAALDLAAAADALAARSAFGAGGLACLAFEPGGEAAAAWAARDARVACLRRIATGAEPGEIAHSLRERLCAPR